MSDIPAPPSWGPPGYHSGPLPQRSSLTGLVTALTVLLAIVALVDLVGAGALFANAAMFEDLAAGRFVDEAAVDAVDALLLTTAVLSGALFLAITVVFIIWQYRHGRNAQALGGRPGLGPGWAIGGWFIPVANMVLPPLQIFQSTRASTGPVQRARGGGLVVAWAVPFYLSNMLAGVELAIYPDDLVTQEDLELAGASDAVGGLANLVSVVAAVMCVVMVRTLTKRQHAAFGQPSALPPPAQPGTAAGQPWGPQQDYTAPRQPYAQPPEEPRRPPAADPWQSPPR